MNALKIKSFALTGSLSWNKTKDIMDQCFLEKDYPKILFLTPEKISNSDTIK